MTQTLCWTGAGWTGQAWAEKPRQKPGRGEAEMPKEKGPRMTPTFTLTSLERALLRLLVNGYALEEAAPSLGLSLPEAETLLAGLQARCGVSSYTRLLVLAVLKAWV